MKKVKNTQSNKGFTLVELIVVIVIILILAAALIPNVVRYIGQARESAFQADAATYLAEIQGYEAEKFGKQDSNLVASDFYDGGSYKLSGFTATNKNMVVKQSLTNEADVALTKYDATNTKGTNKI